MNIPIIIHKDMGVGSSSNLGVETIGNTIASCLCARDYKGISRKGANAIMTIVDYSVIDIYNKRTISKDTLGTSTTNCGGTTNCGSFLLALNPMPDNTSRTIKAQYQQSSAANFSRQDGFGATGVIEERMGNMEQNIRIRKLTPKECWRLQGFPDEMFEKAKASGTSSTQLYKQAGNGVSTNISYTIGLRLMELERQDKDVTEHANDSAE